MKKAETITGQGFLFLKENPIYFAFPLLSAIGNLAAFYLFIYISESIYGVKVFSTASLESWFSLQFWNKINHIVVAVLLIYIFYIIVIRIIKILVVFWIIWVFIRIVFFLLFLDHLCQKGILGK